MKNELQKWSEAQSEALNEESPQVPSIANAMRAPSEQVKSHKFEQFNIPSNVNNRRPTANWDDKGNRIDEPKEEPASAQSVQENRHERNYSFHD